MVLLALHKSLFFSDSKYLKWIRIFKIIEIAEKILDFFNKVFYFVEESIKCIGSDFLPPPSSFESQTLFVIDSELTFHPLLTIFVFFRKQLRRKWGEAQ